VNPDTCEVNSDCVPGTYCSAEGTCVPDPCNSVTCDRGVCERGTGNCVAEDSCDERLPAEQCDSGEKCLEDECVSRENFCDKLICERGVCSFEQDGCVNADDCQGERANCLEGYFCNAENRCQENLCEVNDIDCGQYAECNPATGECDYEIPCEERDDCRAGFVCFRGECAPEVACGFPCPGNQRCGFDEETETSECTEPEICETSIDCLDDRVCGGKSCLEPVSCRNDDMEPNNRMGEATDLFDWAPNGMIQASLCEQETDIYDVTTTDVVPSDFSGQMVATVTVPERDVGLGELTVTMNGPDGSRIGKSTLEATPQDRSVTLTTSLSDSDHGTYTVEVSPGQDVAQNGLEYWLSVRFEKPGATAACNEPRTIAPGQRLANDMSNASATGLGSSCTSTDNPSPEVVYTLETSRPQKVTIEATPKTKEGDATLSLRERCREIATERRCSDASGPGQIASLTAELGEGIYYIVVQAPAGSSLGPYELMVDREYYIECGVGSNYCVDRSTAAICGLDGGAFNQMSCDKGCNPTFGECFGGSAP
jgi:hypothetical protein